MIDFSDIPETTSEFWEDAEVKMPVEKAAISIRLDKDILEFFKKQGKGYQSKINAVLRSYVEHAAWALVTISSCRQPVFVAILVTDCQLPKIRFPAFSALLQPRPSGQLRPAVSGDLPALEFQFWLRVIDFV